MSDEGWTWPLRTPAKRTYDDLDKQARSRITDQLDEIITDQWRDPDEYLERCTTLEASNRQLSARRRV